MKVAVIGCTASDIISSTRGTISWLAKEGHSISAIIAPSEPLQTSLSFPPSKEASDENLLRQVGVARTLYIPTFDYSAITQANADAVSVHIKDIRPSLVIMPSWKSHNHKRKILARVSLIACRGIGTILMYEPDPANNTNFVPSVIFENSLSGSKTKSTDSEVIEEKFESHRTLLLEEDALF